MVKIFDSMVHSVLCKLGMIKKLFVELSFSCDLRPLNNVVHFSSFVEMNRAFCHV